MSRSKHSIRGKEYRAKTRRKPKDIKFFGWTHGPHSNFEKMKARRKREFEQCDPDNHWYQYHKDRWEEVKDKTYPKDLGTGNWDGDFFKYDWPHEARHSEIELFDFDESNDITGCYPSIRSLK